uniref:Uncharacterized protein LOC113799725 n=1 Tax=Dermatophagoides pteronyssinus TaxID=6956 RepID=A0A6P6YMG6_DERPT|nr:uncharacterized protein LOC113799725 [Dermatophagoides pteronyssinus]
MKTSFKFNDLRSVFNRFYKFVQLLHSALIDEAFNFYSQQTILDILIRSITFHLHAIALNFIFTFIYCPIILAFYLIIWEIYFTWFILIYCLLLDYMIIILMTYSLSLFNQQLNSIGQQLQPIIIINQTNFSRKFQLMLLNERLITRKQWGIRIGDLTVVTKWVFMRLIILYARFTLLAKIGWKRFKSLPILERLQFLNATILGIYHLTKSFGWIEYSKTIKFLIGDMTPIMSNDIKYVITINRPIWQLIIHLLNGQLVAISLNFTVLFSYCPFIIGSFTLLLGMKTIRKVRIDIQRILPSINLGFYIFIFKKIININRPIWQLIIHLLNGQLVAISLNFTVLFSYYPFIIGSYTLLIGVKTIQKVRIDIQHILLLINNTSCLRFKLQIMNYYQRMVNLKPWGIKIGAIAVLTRGIFCKLMIIYARFTMLSMKLSG